MPAVDSLIGDYQLRSAVSELLRAAEVSGDFTLQRIPGGANNRVYRLETDRRRMLLKAYFRHPADPRDRLRAESSFLRFAWDRGIRCVPEPLAFADHEGLGLLEYVEGRKLEQDDIGESEVLQAAEFFVALNGRSDDASHLPVASEACFSIEEYISAVEQRLRRIEFSVTDNPGDEDVAELVRRELRPIWNHVQHTAMSAADRAGLAMAATRNASERCLSPSDFGFHNALAEPSGRLRFFDFEYAGWDDPAKMISDFFCQPAVPVSMHFYDQFLSSVRPALVHPQAVAARASLLMPVTQVKWCCIMLNGLLPDGAARRKFASAATHVSSESVRQALSRVLQWLATRE